MPKKNSKAKTVILVLATALIAGGAVAGGFAIKKYVDENAISMPWTDKQFEGTYAGVRLYNDGDHDPVRLGAAAEFKAGVNGERNDFDAYPVYSAMKQKKRGSDIVVTIPEHYVKTIATSTYTDYMMASTKLDDTWLKVPAHDVGAYKGNVTFDSKNKGTMHSQKDAYPSFNFTKVEGTDYAKNGGGFMTTYTEAMDLNYLMTIEFATNNLEDVFSGFKSAHTLEDLAFDIDLQKTGKTNVVRIAAEAINESLGDNKLNEVIIPGFTSFCIQESDGYVSSDIATVTAVKKTNIQVEAQASSSASSSQEAETETVNVYELTIDKTINFEDEEKTLVNRWKARQVADGNEDPDEGDMADPLIQLGNYVKNGLTDGLKGSSNELKAFNGVDLPKGMRPFSYRGIENWYGGLYEWLDGVQTKAVSSEDAEKAGNFLQVCDDKELMGESNAPDAKTPDYKTAFSVTSGNTSGWISGLAEGNETNPFIIAGLQNNEKGSLNDYLNMPGFSTDSESVTLRPVYRGSNWGGGSGDGAFYLDGSNGFSYWNFNIGARLGF